jgi:predicted amidohydrolase
MKLKTVKPWAVDPRAAAVTRKKNGSRFVTAGNGTRTCCGGWQLEYTDILPGQTYDFSVDVETENITWVRDTLVCYGIWENNNSGITHNRDFLFARPAGPNRTDFTGQFTAPEGTTRLTLYYIFRWTAEGTAVWQMPKITPAETPSPAHPVRISIVTGKAEDKPSLLGSVEANMQYYAARCEQAVEKDCPGLIVLPEIALQWGVAGSSIDKAVSVPGPETGRFSEIAESGNTYIVIGVLEKRNDTVYNSAVLLDPNGGVAGRYRKVHLAEGGEWLSEITPGTDFPVFETGIGRIGFNICMDSSVAESSRMVGLQGADFLALPIMGDLRANSVSGGEWSFDSEKWKAIMRVRAMDQKLCMAVARNHSEGSCIINPRGDVLAWNNGDHDFISADVQVRDFYRMRGYCQTRLNWFQRRPHLYKDYIDTTNYGPF